jgi:galactonate dehydratase
VRIAEVETLVVANPSPGVGGRYFIFVKVTTDSGVVGWGEAYSFPFHPRVVPALVGDVAERHLIGADPFRIEWLWHRIYGSGYTQRPDTSLMAVLSALETACWDIIGKELGRPVYDLLGGKVRERLRSYTYLYQTSPDDPVYTDPDTAAERAAAYVERGFTAVKFDPVAPYTSFDPRQLSLETLERAERYVRAVREAVGDRCDLLFGTHGQMTPAGALRLARRLEPYDPLWLEEPTPPESPEEMAKVARGTSIPIATGERLAGKHEFARVLATGAASILQPALGRCGGILEAKKIAAIAEAHYAQMAPHVYCGPIEAAASIQFDACIPNFLIQESINTFDGFHAELLTEPIAWEDGYLVVPDRPGIGHELNEEVARAHPYDGDELHFDMHPEPL